MSKYNSIGRLLFGKNFIPRPGNNESVADSIENNRRSVDYNNSIVKGLPNMTAPAASLSMAAAMDDPSFMRTFGRLVGSPDEADISIDQLNRKMHKRSSLLKRAVERLKGGLGDFKSDKTFNKSELAKGVVHEREHTKNRSIAKEIAKDHLSERKDYYSALDKSGLE